MTLPDERLKALRATKQLLLDLVSPKTTAKIPVAIRKRALGLLMHFPEDYVVEKLPECMSEFFADLGER